MTTNKQKGSVLVGVACVAIVFGGSSLSAAVIDLRNAARAETSLIHHYTFEETQTDYGNLRLLDRVGTLHLKEYPLNLPAGSKLVYETGFDALSMGGTAVHVTNSIHHGAGWVSTNAIALPATLTVECLVCPRGVPGVADYDNTFLLSSKDGDRRGYFLTQTKSSKFQIRVGNKPEETILDPYITNHWYYVVSTYVVSGGQTTVNAYYADLTAGGELQHPIVNKNVSDHYGSGAILGVGCLVTNTNGIPTYFAPSTIDEVAFYNAVFSPDKISARLTELRCELPVVEYREIFPCDNMTQHNISIEGWKTHYGTNAIYFSNIVTPQATTAFDEDLPAIASLPQDTGVTYGYLNNYGGPTNWNYLYWTDEMTNQLDVSWLKMVTFDTRSATNRTLRIALRVDTNDTPTEVEDDLWFIGDDFDHAPGTSALAIPKAAYEPAIIAWRRHWFDVSSGEWTELSFTPESKLVKGDTKVSLPTNGMVTAFGLFQDYHEYSVNMRLDNFTIYARRVYPPQGTLILLQ